MSTHKNVPRLEIENQCEHCGNVYRTHRRITTTAYCSRDCYQKARKKAAIQYTPKACEQCGEQLTPRKRTDGGLFFRKTDYYDQRFCSTKCHIDSLKMTIDQIVSRLKIDPVTNCHIWTGPMRGFYGRVGWNGKLRSVHRIVWEHFRGPIPEGLQMDHTCGAKLCCNVDHLRLVTPRDNSLAATSNNMAARNHSRVKCPQCGGPYSAFPNGVRYCKPCRHRVQMAYQRRYRAAKRKRKE